MRHGRKVMAGEGSAEEHAEYRSMITVAQAWNSQCLPCSEELKKWLVELELVLRSHKR